MDPNLATGETTSEGSDIPPMMPPTAAPGELAVPLKALAQPDDAEQVNPPAQGDPVTFTVDATVTRIDGEMAYIKATAINGVELEDEAAEPAGLPDEQEGADLRAMAEQQTGI